MRPDDRRYRESHEWAKVEGDVVIIGITDHAVEQLGDLTFLEVRVEAGQEIKKDDHFGEIESVKTVADLYSPVSGTIKEVNTALADDLEQLQESPFETGWMMKIAPANPGDVDAMLSAEAYEKHIADA